jgi:hypothetical protein
VVFAPTFSATCDTDNPSPIPPTRPDTSAQPRSTPSSGECQGSAEVTVKHQPKHCQASPEDKMPSIDRGHTPLKWGGRDSPTVRTPAAVCPHVRELRATDGFAELFDGDRPDSGIGHQKKWRRRQRSAASAATTPAADPHESKPSNHFKHGPLAAKNETKTKKSIDSGPRDRTAAASSPPLNRIAG